MEKPKTVYAKHEYAKISPKKVVPVMNLVRGKSAVEAERILKFDTTKGAKLTLKVLMSAVANAKSAHNMSEENLIVSEIYSNAGPMANRYQPTGRGRAGPILKRTSHIIVGVSERKGR